MLPEAITLRGEMATLFAAALVLWLAIRPVAVLTGLPRALVGDLFWAGGVAFVIVGHVAYLAIAAPRSLLDPFVLIRVQSGIEPLAGVVALGAVGWWYARDWAAVRGRVALVLVAGLAAATITYDAGCVLRDACYGAPAPAPLGFPMAGLAETRVATPLVEAALLLLLLAAVVRAWPRLDPWARAAWIGAGLALVRVALTPLSVAGADAIDVRTALTLAIGLAAAGIAAWRTRVPATDARGSTSGA